MKTRILSLAALLLLAPAAGAQPMIGDLFITEQNSGSPSDDGTVMNISGGGDFTGLPRFATGMDAPQDICVGPNGDLYVTEQADGAVTIVTNGGDVIAATPHASGLTAPMGLSCTPTQILVVEFASGEVTDVTAPGDHSATTPFASGLDSPTGIFRDSNGTLFVTENTVGEITDITSGGDFTGVAAFANNAPGGSGLMGMTEWNGALLVADLNDGLVIDFSAGGDLSAAPVFANISGVEQLEPVPGFGLLALSTDNVVAEISTGAELPFANGIGVISASGGIHYVAGCGDGFVQPGEQCDDGNSNDDDGCRNDCTAELCGDGILDPDEECDDGNTTLGDGCSDMCLIVICGDSTIGDGEECDDGNTAPLDGCDASCLIEACGNGVVQEGEECDDGNTLSGDECSPTCQLAACTPAPLAECAPAIKGSLSADEKKVGGEKLKATLSKFDAGIPLGDLGTPVTADTTYAVCIYDGSNDALLVDLGLDSTAGQLCGAKGKPCWKAKGTKGFDYKDSDAAEAGVKKLALKAGAAGKGKVQLDAGNKEKKGQTSLQTGIASALGGVTSARLQIVADGGSCYEGFFTTVKKADGVKFKAKLP